VDQIGQLLWAAQGVTDREGFRTAPSARKYGDDRARRYATLEAGHAAQNLLLEAVALDLGAVPIGAFDDRRVAQLLRLDAREAPLYLVPVGYPRP
jgi:SagB-type dehydrogenase family enzyme